MDQKNEILNQFIELQKLIKLEAAKYDSCKYKNNNISM